MTRNLSPKLQRPVLSQRPVLTDEQFKTLSKYESFFENTLAKRYSKNLSNIPEEIRQVYDEIFFQFNKRHYVAPKCGSCAARSEYWMLKRLFNWYKNKKNNENN